MAGSIHDHYCYPKLYLKAEKEFIILDEGLFKSPSETFIVEYHVVGWSK